MDQPDTASNRMGNELRFVATFIGSMWIIQGVNTVFPGLNLTSYGLEPRTFHGLIGILTMPFLHGSWWHLIGNSVPLSILLVVLTAVRRDAWSLVLEMILLGGGILWIFGRPHNTIGASGLVYALISFLVVNGFVQKRFIPILVSLLIGFMYGTTFLFGIFGSFHSEVSWDGHLCGGIAGAMIAFWYADKRKGIAI